MTLSNQSRLSEQARELMQGSSDWSTVHSKYNPTLKTRHGEIFRADGFDEEYWGESAPGEVLELWFSERGERRRVFRTGSADAFVRKVVLDGLARQGKWLWRTCEFDARPEGFEFEMLSGNQGVAIGWGTSSWAEFQGRFQLSNALTYCHFLNSSSKDVSAAIASRDGAPLLQRSSRTDPCGPPPNSRGEVTVELWERWLREREGAQYG